VLNLPSLKAVITEGQRAADIALLLKVRFEQYEYDPFSECLTALLCIGLATTRYFCPIYRSLPRH
jgi:hypothetical protein